MEKFATTSLVRVLLQQLGEARLHIVFRVARPRAVDARALHQQGNRLQFRRLLQELLGEVASLAAKAQVARVHHPSRFCLHRPRASAGDGVVYSKEAHAVPVHTGVELLQRAHVAFRMAFFG
jgi:hypothetical protein